MFPFTDSLLSLSTTLYNLIRVNKIKNPNCSIIDSGYLYTTKLSHNFMQIWYKFVFFSDDKENVL